MAATADGLPATGNMKLDTQIVDTEKETEMKTEQDEVHDKQKEKQQEEVLEKQLQTQQERQQETQRESQHVGDEVEIAPPLPPRSPPPTHDEKRASLQQPPLVRFAALPPPLTEHQQPIQVYEPGEELPPVERPFFPRWHKFKIWAMFLSLVSSAVVFGVAIGMGFINADYMEPWGFYPIEIELGLSGATAGLAIVFVTFEHLRILFSARRRGMHPGLLVTFNLFICLLGIGACMATGAYVTDWGYEYYDYSTVSDAGHTNLILQQVLLAFDCILLLIHFVLFIGACVETHKTNRAKRRTIIVTIPADGSMPEQVYEYTQRPPSHIHLGPPAPHTVMTNGSHPVQAYQYAVQPSRDIRWGPPAPLVQQPSPQRPVVPPQVSQYAGYYAPAPPVGSEPVQFVQQQPLQGYYAPPCPSRELSAPHRSSLREAPPAAAAAASSSSSGLA